MRTKLAGISLLLVAALLVGWHVIGSWRGPPVRIDGYVGGEKMGFLEDEAVQKRLAEQYGVSLNYTRMGSLDMAVADMTGRDYLFPSSSIAMELYQQSGGHYAQIEDAFVSPIVLYSWGGVADALEAKGVVSRHDGVYTVDMAALVTLIQQDASWADIGLPQLFGKVCVFSTDPTRSNSGNLMAALMATVLNGNQTVSAADVPGLIDPLRNFLHKSGYKETSSSDLFSQYLRTGMGGKPLVALYESQMIEFAAENPSDWEKIKDDVRILYPTPTVWSNHPFIAVDENATRFIEAMRDPGIQQIAWERHGFRSGATGNVQLTSAMQDMGIRESIQSVIQIPDYAAMTVILKQLETN